MISLGPKSVKLPQESVKAQNPLTHRHQVNVLCGSLSMDVMSELNYLELFLFLKLCTCMIHDAFMIHFFEA